MNYFSNTCNPNSSESSSAANINGKEKKKSNGGKRGKVVKLSTDPQSVAARQRRHRISDRFKILQTLVPGGTKMDTVSMLEEAIHYVKFLKTQIWLHQTMIMMNFTDDNNNPSQLTHSVPQSSLHAHDQSLYNYNLMGQVQGYKGYSSHLPDPCCFQGDEGTKPFNPPMNY